LLWVANNARFDLKETFSFGGLSPPNKKIIPLRPRRLCGEISLSDKSDALCLLFPLPLSAFRVLRAGPLSRKKGRAKKIYS